MKLIQTLLAACCLAAFMTGCSSASKSPVKEEMSPRAVRIFHGDGSPATWDEMVGRAAAAQAVLVGENHGHPLGLASAAALWDDILAKAPQAQLAMEFFERDEQTALDDYFTGVTDEAAFRKAAARSDGNYPPGHRMMVEAAKARKRPVIAANAPRRYVRIARLEGYDRLSALGENQRAMFRIPDSLPTGPYREAFDKVMAQPTEGTGKAGSHGGAAAPVSPEEAAKKERERLDATFRSQSLWDWTMSESVDRGIRAGSQPVVLVVGRFHIDSQGGTLLALRQQHPGVTTVTVSFVNEWGEALGSEDKDRADFVVYVGPSAEE